MDFRIDNSLYMLIFVLNYYSLWQRAFIFYIFLFEFWVVVLEFFTAFMLFFNFLEDYSSDMFLYVPSYILFVNGALLYWKVGTEVQMLYLVQFVIRGEFYLSFN